MCSFKAIQNIIFEHAKIKGLNHASPIIPTWFDASGFK